MMTNFPNQDHAQGAEFVHSDECLPALQTIDLSPFGIQNAQLDCFRLDQAHPQISGNKWYKLKHHLAEARRQGYRKLVSFGGAYSNHLHALSYAASKFDFELTALVRGERPKELTPTLIDCQTWGASLVWLPRADYATLSRSVSQHLVSEQFPEAYIIPEGGEGALGVLGVMELFQALRAQQTHSYDMWVCGVGSGTTMAGMAMAAGRDTEVLGFSALKGAYDLEQRIQDAISETSSQRSLASAISHWQVCHDYHFGGFAKMPQRLTNFISTIHSTSGLLLDPVYTAKAFFGTLEWIQHKKIRSGSKVLFVHTGGLQGWRGLSAK